MVLQTADLFAQQNPRRMTGMYASISFAPQTCGLWDTRQACLDRCWSPIWAPLVRTLTPQNALHCPALGTKASKDASCTSGYRAEVSFTMKFPRQFKGRNRPSSGLYSFPCAQHWTTTASHHALLKLSKSIRKPLPWPSHPAQSATQSLHGRYSITEGAFQMAIDEAEHCPTACPLSCMSFIVSIW